MPQSVPLSRIITSLLVVFVVVCVVPLIALATYNHPSPTDDYCFANTVLNYGFWEAQQFYYDGWTGRYFHNFIVHANPLVIGWYGGYKLYPVIFLALLAGGFYWLASQWLYQSFGTGVKVGVGLGLFLGFIATLASIPEYLYWWTGLGSYGLSSALFLFLLATLLAHQRRGFGLQPVYLLIESLLVTAIVGSSEMTMVLILSVLALIAFGELIQRRRVSLPTLVLLGVAAVSCYYLLKAPGNAIRLGGNPNSSNIPLTLVSSLRYAIPYCLHQIVLTPWLPLSLLYLPIAWQLIGPRLVGPRLGRPEGFEPIGDKPQQFVSGGRVHLPPYLRLHPVWGVLHGFATVLALISLHFYGVGIAPIPRLINIVNLTFWLSWIYNLTLLVAMLRGQLQPARWQAYVRPIAFVLIIWVAVAAAFGPVLPVAYGDWLSGRAAQYDREMLGRYAQLTKPGNPRSVIAPLTNYPVSLFLEDLHDNPQHLWNRCWADYFDKKTITLGKKSSQSRQ